MAAFMFRQTPTRFTLTSLRSQARRPSIRALAGTLCGSAPGFVLPFAVAAHFGVGRTSDAYVYALSIATFGLTLSISVLEPNGLPLAQSALQRGPRALRSFAQRTSLAPQASLASQRCRWQSSEHSPWGQDRAGRRLSSTSRSFS